MSKQEVGYGVELGRWVREKRQQLGYTQEQVWNRSVSITWNVYMHLNDDHLKAAATLMASVLGLGDDANMINETSSAAD